MTVGKPVAVVVGLGDLTQASQGELAPSSTTATIKTPCQVSAQLIGPSPAYTITPDGFQTTGFKDRPFVSWPWSVTAHQAGSGPGFQLRIEIQPVFSGQLLGSLRAFPIDVTVSPAAAPPVSLWTHVQNFFSNSVLLGLVAIISAATGVAALRSSRKKKRRTASSRQRHSIHP